MSDYDYTARRTARNAESRANEAVNYTARLEGQFQDLMREFSSAVSRIKELDKPANQFPLKNKD